MIALDEEPDAPSPEVLAERRRLRALSFTHVVALDAEADEAGDVGTSFAARREIRRRREAVNLAYLRVRPERQRAAR